MLRIALVAVNARFTHTNPALRSMKAYTESKLKESVAKGELCLSLHEYTINEPLSWLEDSLLQTDADIYLFSTYIWNVDTVFKLVEALKKGRPEVLIGLGGPEVTYTAQEELMKLPEADFVLAGEGEYTLYRLCAVLLDKSNSFDDIPGFIGRKQVGPPAVQLDLAEIPYYWEENLVGLQDRMIYYESSRGCPFSCTYCLSSADQGVRYLPLARVFAELDRLVDEKALIIKFVDRSFNADRKRAIAIWQHLIERYEPGQRTCFHFEIEPHLLDQESIDVLSSAPEGLFQLEIGIQTTTDTVLQAVKRKGDFSKIAPAVQVLRAANNMHLHLDLIAGLPGETIQSFAQAFDDVFRLHPHALQLGFLKILKGTEIEYTAKKLDMRWRSTAPYEIICSDAMNYNELAILKAVEVVLDRYYNSGYFVNSILALSEVQNSPFLFFCALADFCRSENLLFGRFAKDRYAGVLYRFMTSEHPFFRGRKNEQKEIAELFSVLWQKMEKPGVMSWQRFLEKFAY